MCRLAMGNLTTNDMKHYRKLYLTIALISCVYTLRAGGGWPAAKGSTYLKFNQFVIRSDDYFNPDGDIISISTSSIYLTSVYAEHGITDKLTGIVYLPFFARATLNEQKSASTGEILQPGDAVNSIGDADVTFKYGLITGKPIVVSAGITFGLPLGNPEGGDTGVLQTGDGEFNVMLTIEASRSFNGGKGYVNTLIGYNNRSNNFSDEFRIGAEVGYRIAPKLLTALKLYSVNSLNNGDDLETPSNGIFSNNIEYLAVTPEVNYFFNESSGISAAVGFAPYGRRVLASPSYSLGVFFNFTGKK